MPCYRPLKGYRAPGGKILFSPAGAYVDQHVEVACGQCIGCRLERSRHWATRIMHEAACHDANSFVTLTYDDAHLPPGRSLNVRDWQLFAKTLRRNCHPFRFYHCGEYGDQTERPHIHACLFGMDFAQDRKLYRSTRGNHLYTSATLEACWPHGFAVIGDLTFDSAAYVARYCTKKVTGPAAGKHYAGRKPEYATMSRRPGIGAAYLAKHKDQIYPRDEVIVNGRPTTPPRYYDNQLEKTDPDLLHRIKLERRKKAARHRGDLTPERLATREEVKRREKEYFLREPTKYI